MKKSRIGAWILIVALLMQNIPLSVWASGEQGTSYFGAGQSTEADAAKASSGSGQAAGQTEATEPAVTMPSTGDRKSTRLNSSHRSLSRMPSSA